MDYNDDLAELKQLRDAIAEAERDLHQTEGRLQILYAQLGLAAGTKNLKKALDKVTDINKQLFDTKKEIDVEMEKLRQNYEW